MSNKRGWGKDIFTHACIVAKIENCRRKCKREREMHITKFRMSNERVELNLKCYELIIDKLKYYLD